MKAQLRGCHVKIEVLLFRIVLRKIIPILISLKTTFRIEKRFLIKIFIRYGMTLQMYMPLFPVYELFHDSYFTGINLILVLLIQTIAIVIRGF
jgi:hypothetical protein